MRRALITGSEGFVGRHFRDRLLRDGWAVYECDIVGPMPKDCRDVFAAEADVRYDLVIHCAAIVGGRAKIDGDPLAIADNLGIDAALFRWAAKARPEHLVYFSSSAAYPIQLQQRGCLTPLREDWINDCVALPDQTYGWVKLTGERLAQQARREGVNVHIVRPFSGYGEDQSTDYPFPSFIERAKRGADPFDIWGDGMQVRDFIHIDDIVEATMRLAEYDIPGPVNLGTGRGVSFRELAALVMRRIPALRLHRDKPVGVHYRVADTSALHQFYLPRVSLEEGIARALR